jgi:hypothetical protein
MKTKGKIVWLITWEGPGSEHNGRCKIVAIVPPQFGENIIRCLLRVLFHSESNLTLCEKVIPNISIEKDPFFKEVYRHKYPEFWYGYIGQAYLRARKVKYLRSEENKQDRFESTLSWTELPKFILNPKVDFDGPIGQIDSNELTKEAKSEGEASYTYSIRPGIDEEKERRARRAS